jgi:predicted ATPase
MTQYITCISKVLVCVSTLSVTNADQLRAIVTTYMRVVRSSTVTKQCCQHIDLQSEYLSNKQHVCCHCCTNHQAESSFIRDVSLHLSLSV